jgi:hypothetical protein
MAPFTLMVFRSYIGGVAAAFGLNVLWLISKFLPILFLLSGLLQRS